MLSNPSGAASMDPQTPVPWSCGGGADHEYSSADRKQYRAALTDPRLAERARAVDQDCELDYERMIRVLALVWDCPEDGAVNVTGYRCSRCGTPLGHGPARPVTRRAAPGSNRRMEISKEQIIQVLRSTDDQAKAEKAANKRPEQVDTDRDSELLAKLGIDPKQFTGDLGEGLAGF